MRSRVLSCLVVSLLFVLAVPAVAQTTGTLTGTVTHDGASLPGVLVTISSPQLQGTRTAITNDAGGFNFPALPPGEYTVHYEMEGMADVTKTVRVGVAQTGRADADLRLTAVAEAITVTATASPVLETTEVQSNIQGALVEELPVGRTIIQTALLAPGTSSTGARNALMISGGFSHDNLIMVNGAVVQENLRGQTHNLFIEDAIQETTVMSGSISAEYGRFTGGVVSTITKSGGNEFMGSVRDSLTNPSWTKKTPFPGQAEPADELSEVWEATFGGRIIRDRLWFFTAARLEESSADVPFTRSSKSFTNTIEEERLEAKLTAALTAKHNIVGSYLDAPRERGNDCQLGCWEIGAIDPVAVTPNDFKTAQYSGILSPNFLVEVGYSEKYFAFEGFGGEDRDPIKGTPIRHLAPGFTGVSNAPYFCGNCTDEERNNDSLGAKATYYLGTRALGTHNIVAGFEQWSEQRLANNFQSPTNMVFIHRMSGASYGSDGSVLMSIKKGDYLAYYPILQQSLGSDLATDSIFINDKWDLNRNFSFNLGVRYDRNDAVDSAGNKTADDAAISPRVGAIYDIRGDGRYRINASFGTYVGRLAETVAGAGSSAGSPAFFGYEYRGPDITETTNRAALAQFFSWFNAQGGLDANELIFSASVPGVNRRLLDTLESPSTDEWTLGFGMQLGSKGYFRTDYIKRDWKDFYVDRTVLSNGKVKDSLGRTFDLTYVANTNELERTYDGVSLQAAYRPLSRVQIGANYTWSELYGNVTGENIGSGPISEGGYIFQYPEYQGFTANNPKGILPWSQEHKLAAWVGYDVPLPIAGNLNLSLLQRFDSGSPYSISGTIDVRKSTSLPNGIENPGYQTPPTQVTYFFSDRGAFNWEDVHSTDLALNYTFPITRISLFVQGELLNAFDNDAQIAGDTTVRTWVQNKNLKPFNPFTETPVEGVHWEKGPNFGKATSAGSYQTPRTYRFSLGLRF